ncbi:hypothetical protein sphantq_00156 [Sphingobium sp. AntQ-1]|nr:hypothetical protein sphantq_00156 [Sphingobium sp. AntQ-1]
MRSMFARAGILLGIRVKSAARISDGDLNSVARLGLPDGRTVIAKRGPLVEKEAAMIDAIRETGTPVPATLAVEKGLLILSDLPAEGWLARSWGRLLRRSPCQRSLSNAR